MIEQAANSVTLPDGYSGHTANCLIEPLAVDGTCVKLRVAASDYLIRWVTKTKYCDLVRAAGARQTTLWEDV